MTAGTLYLIPVSLAQARWESYLPTDVRVRSLCLDYFIVENAKTARAKLKQIGYEKPIRQVTIETLPEEPSTEELAGLLGPVIAGRDCGLMSEAGCPAIADPGSKLVRAAHRLGIHVAPLVGPSSILLALMASGLNGQSFAFHGYLPIPDAERESSIRALERESLDRSRTQIFIETPYRNDRLFASLVANCRPNTLLCLATDVTGAAESISTQPISDWRRSPRPLINKQPTVFLLLAEESA